VSSNNKIFKIMKITVTGSLGNISRPLTATLVKAGHEVTVISSKLENQAAIEVLGAKAAIGSVEDVAFLTRAFAGADAVYTMVPPNFSKTDYRQYLGEVGRNYAEAIKANGVKHVVNLSSVGAHLPAGTGPIAGLYDVEHIMNELDGVAVKHVRAGFFFINFYAQAGMIKDMGIMGSNYSADDMLVMVHPNDIATVVAEEIQKPFNGKSVRYAVSDVRTVQEVTETLTTAVGKPEVKWVEFTDEQSYGGMLQAGLPEPIASMYAEMNAAVRGGKLFEHFVQHKEVAGKTKLEDFAKEFAAGF
jgi:uncharacterized protein YbjT (DUF2867 family)